MKQSKLNLALFSMGVLIIIQSCAVPQPVARLSPLGENYDWLNGTENMIFPANEGIEVELQFIQSTSNQLLFEVGITNRSDQKVYVDPSRFSIQLLSLDTLTPSGTPLFAFDPESQILRMDLQKSREQAEASNDAALELIGQTLDIASDIASIGQEKDPEVQAQEQADRAERRQDYENSEIDREIRLQSLDDQRRYWSGYALRKTSLKPGYKMRGTVFFPRNNQARFMKVKLDIDSLVFEASYEQKLFR